jgi:hypothetical protein
MALVGAIFFTPSYGAEVLSQPNAPPGAVGSIDPPADPNVIKDARSILRGIEPASTNNAMVYFDQNQVNFKSYISLEKQAPGQLSSGAITCLTPSDAKCTSALADPTFQQIKYDVAMGSCQAREKAACINSFSLVKADGSKVKATPVKRIYNKTSPGWDSTFDATSNSGYPGADAPWIWRISDAGKDTDYLILGLVSALFNRSTGSSTWDASEKSMRLSIYPVKSYANGSYIEGTGQTSCLAVDPGLCYQRIAFASDLRFSLDLRIPKVITGWLNGRLDKPVAYTESYDANYSELIIEAAPLEEIISGKWLENTGSVAQYLNDSKRLFTAAPGSKNLDVAGTDPDDQNAVNYYSSMSKLLGNSALTNSLTWRINTTSSGAQTFASTCAKIEGVQGIVTSNASVYEPGSPKWDSTEGALGYRIAAPTYKSDSKTENIGRYAFAMRADLMKCVYGMAKLPAYAKVEITYDDTGDKKTASVILGTSKDWVHLHADNFAYTSVPPKVAVKLEGWVKSATSNTQTPSAENSATAKPVAPVVPGKITITCIKGTNKKTVTGTKPVCPSGYKMQQTTAQKQSPATITCVKGTSKKTVTGVKPQCPSGYKITSDTATQPVATAQPGQEILTPVLPAGNTSGLDPLAVNPLPINPNADITITCTKGTESKQVTGKSPVQCPAGYQMKPMQPGQPGQPGLAPLPGAPTQPGSPPIPG